MSLVLPWILLACVRPGPPKPAAAQDPASLAAPADARGWYLRALYAETRGERAEADRAIAWALRLDRANPWVWLAAARLAAAQGDPIRAAERACAALERAPDLADARALIQEVAPETRCGL